jgi:hypothetical protein
VSLCAGLLAACGGAEDEKSSQSQAAFVPTDWSKIAYDWIPPSLIVSLRDASGETGRPAIASASALIVSDEPLLATSSGTPSGFHHFEGQFFFSSARATITFADTSRKLVRIDFFLPIEGHYSFSFSLADTTGNITRASLQFTTRNALGASSQPAAFNAYADAQTFVAQNGNWTPSGTWYSPTSGASYGFGTVQSVSSAENPRNLPVFHPPLIMKRVRGPNYTWIYEHEYQYACPSGYYCPPANSIVTNPPVIPPHSLQGLAGAIIKLCWELDCGGILGEHLISRGIRLFGPRPGG